MEVSDQSFRHTGDVSSHLARKRYRLERIDANSIRCRSRLFLSSAIRALLIVIDPANRDLSSSTSPRRRRRGSRLLVRDFGRIIEQYIYFCGKGREIE